MYEYSDKIYRITSIKGKRYFLNDNNDQKQSYLGYELMLVESSVDKDGYDVTLAEVRRMRARAASISTWDMFRCLASAVFLM